MNTGHQRLLLSLLLACVTLAVYAPVLTFDFVRYDDPAYVVENPDVQAGLSAGGVARCFTTRVGGNWHPVTMLSHLLDGTFYGLRPGGHHLTNLLLHVLNVVLLFLGLAAITGRIGPSALAAALFALHPMNVESVAWIAERKNVLSTFFWLATFAVYVAQVRRPSLAREAAVLGVGALALMAKPMAVSLPLTLLVMDFWPLGRWPATRLRTLIAEKIPLILLAGGFALTTLISQKSSGAVATGSGLSLTGTVAVVAVNVVRYLGKLAAPVRLAALYPAYPSPLPFSAAAVAAALLLLAAFTAVAFVLRRTQPWLAAGWAWFLLTLAPVSGIVPVGNHSVADRYVYVPAVGLFVAAAWTLGAAAGRGRAGRIAATAVGAALVVACAALSIGQLRYWRNSEALFRRAIAVTGGNYIMHENLGRELVAQGRMEEAVAEFERAVAIQPGDLPSRMNLALACLQSGRRADCLRILRETIAMYPDARQAHYALGRLLAEDGRREEAAHHLRLAGDNGGGAGYGNSRMLSR